MGKDISKRTIDNVTQVLTFKSLNYFDRLSKNLNYTQTAQLLGITQPALTQQIKKIEHIIGVPLFIKSGKHLQLTDAGRTLLKAVHEASFTLESAINDIQETNIPASGIIRLGILSSIEDSVLDDFIIQYTDVYPDVSIELRKMNRRDIWYDLENNIIDLAVMYLPDSVIKDWKAYESKNIFDEHVQILYDNPAWKGKSKVDLKDLLDHDWVSSSRGYYMSEVFNERYKQLSLERPNVIARFCDSDQLLRFAQRKPVYIALPESYVYANQSKIKIDHAKLDSVSFNLAFVYKSEKKKIPRFSEFFKEWDKFVVDDSYGNRLKKSIPV